MAADGELRTLIEEIRNSMVTNARFDELIKRMDEKDEKISELEDKIKELEKQNELFERRLDDVESYGRRQNLRIIGIPPPPTGTERPLSKWKKR